MLIFLLMIDYIDSQISFLNEELAKEENDEEKVRELLKIFMFFRELYLNVIGKRDSNNSLVAFTKQFLNLNGAVDMKELVKQFLSSHDLKQGDAGLHQVTISNFLRGKHEIQTNSIEKLFNNIKNGE